jgi:hypothetical protein
MSNYASSGTMTPLALCEPRRVTMPISHTIEQCTLPTASLISRQVIPYRTRGSTYCPGMSTPKTRSLVDSSITIHITWQNPTVSAIPSYAQTTTSILTTAISHLDGRKTNSQQQISQTKHHEDGKTCTTLMTAWLSITNEVWTQILKYEA